MNNAAEPCLAPKEVAALLGISERSALRLMASQEIESFRVGRLWRTTADRVAAFIRRQIERTRPLRLIL